MKARQENTLAELSFSPLFISTISRRKPPKAVNIYILYYHQPKFKPTIHKRNLGKPLPVTTGNREFSVKHLHRRSARSQNPRLRHGVAAPLPHALVAVRPRHREPEPPEGCGSKLRRGKPQVLVHVSTSQAWILVQLFFLKPQPENVPSPPG